MILSPTSKCANCLNLYGYNIKSIAPEFHMGCKEHFQRFWDVLEEEINVCPFYIPYQLELNFETDIKNN